MEVEENKVLSGTPGAVSFEHLLGWLDQLRRSLDENDKPIIGPE